MADLTGQQLGNYRLIRIPGEGGFAEVYLGEHIHLGTQAAIKVLHTQLASNDVEQFRNEARIIAHLLHPNIVRVLDFGVEGKTPFLVMDYAPNGTLRKLHPKGTRLPLAIIVSYVKQIAAGLQYAHNQKLIHRDIKLENMLIGRNNNILLSDFGIALIAQSSHYQNTQDVVGTVAYMSPEQIQGKPRPASDQYSLGIIVYEWLSGDRPFNGSFTEIAVQHAITLPQPLHERIPISSTVEQVVMRALEKDPHRRFPNVQAFANALEQASLLSTPLTAVQPVGVNHHLNQFPQPTSAISTLGQFPPPTIAAPYPNGQIQATVVNTPQGQSASTQKLQKGKLWLVLIGLIILVIGSSVIYFKHNTISTDTRNIQSKTSVVGSPNQTRTSSSASTPTSTSVTSPGQVHIFDNAGVLDVSQVQNEAATLPAPIDIYTTNSFTGTKSQFDQTTVSQLGNKMNLIVIAIDTVHRHLAIVRGSNVPLSNSQIQSAVNAFASNFNNVDYTGATIAAIHSLRSSLVGAAVIQEVNGKAKPYQVRQFLELVEQYDLKLGD